MAARKRMNKPLLIVLAAWAVLGIAMPAHAELVFFASGRSMSVKSHRAEGDAIVLVLRAGGEIVCDSATIARIAPDEVPYPEPEAEAPPAPALLPPAIPAVLCARAAGSPCSRRVPAGAGVPAARGRARAPGLARCQARRVCAAGRSRTAPA